MHDEGEGKGGCHVTLSHACWSDNDDVVSCVSVCVTSDQPAVNALSPGSMTEPVPSAQPIPSPSDALSYCMVGDMLGLGIALGRCGCATVCELATWQ